MNDPPEVTLEDTIRDPMKLVGGMPSYLYYAGWSEAGESRATRPAAESAPGR